jgi:hypothetical protein
MIKQLPYIFWLTALISLNFKENNAVADAAKTLQDIHRTCIELLGHEPSPEKIEFEDSSYIIPNELNPSQQAAHIKDAPAGVYVTVGTERALFAAIVSPNIESLFIIDKDPTVIRFHQINTKLLAASRDRQHYLESRKYVSCSDWLDLGLSNDDCIFWITNLIKQDSWVLNNPPDAEEATDLLSPVNYLYNNSAYERVHQLALDNRIYALQGDVSNADFMLRMLSEFKKRGIAITALDFSNAWSRAYIPRDKLKAVLNAIWSQLDTHSRIVFTHHFGSAEIIPRHNVRNWRVGHVDYFSFGPSTIDTSVEDYIDATLDKEEIIPIISKKKYYPIRSKSN